MSLVSSSLTRARCGLSPASLLVAVVVSFVAACGDGDAPHGPLGVEARPIPKGCVGFDRAGIARATPALQALGLTSAPVQLVHHPSEPWWYVVEQGGVIRRFVDAANVSSSELVADLTSVVYRRGIEDGLLGLAFAPDFEVSGEVIVKYTAPVESDAFHVLNRVSRLQSFDGGATFPVELLREVITVEVPQMVHHGGPPKFGPDGLLYIPVGDGSYEHTTVSQELDSLEGKFLRIDTRVAPYTIPPNNPFVGVPGVRPEIFALGLRNPHGWTFDPAGDALWVGDVGLHEWEEIDRVVAGGNYGWPYAEGLVCRIPPCDPSFIDPVYKYPNTGGSAVIVGDIYRGDAFPELRGQLVFGDFGAGRVRALDITSGTYEVTHVVDSGLVTTALGTDPEGEILILQVSGGIARVEPNPTGRPVPISLAETGCVDLATPRLAPDGLVPYDVNMPLWSDGTGKARWFSVPAGQRVALRDDGAFSLPVGSVAVKTFFMGERPIETRLFVRHADGEWAGYNYEWSADGKDAQLLAEGKIVEIEGLPWLFPHQAQCFACHTEAAGRTLGLETAQLNGPMTYPNGNTENQLVALERVGILEPGAGIAITRPKFPARDDESAAPDVWARAYLHANCSFCHRAGGPGRGSFSLLYRDPLAAAGCGVTPEVDTLGVSDSLVVSPQHPDASVLLLRMQQSGPTRMPPLASTIVDDLASRRVRDWILSTEQCQ